MSLSAWADAKIHPNLALCICLNRSSTHAGWMDCICLGSTRQSHIWAICMHSRTEPNNFTRFSISTDTINQMPIFSHVCIQSECLCSSRTYNTSLTPCTGIEETPSRDIVEETSSRDIVEETPCTKQPFNWRRPWDDLSRYNNENVYSISLLLFHYLFRRQSIPQLSRSRG